MSTTTGKEVAEYDEDLADAVAATTTGPAPVETIEPDPDLAPEQPESGEEAQPEPDRFRPMGGMPQPFSPPAGR